jgi:hypothetical protein
MQRLKGRIRGIMLSLITHNRPMPVFSNSSTHVLDTNFFRKAGDALSGKVMICLHYLFRIKQFPESSVFIEMEFKDRYRS